MAGRADDTLAATQRLIRAYEEALVDVERLRSVEWLPWSGGAIGRHIRVPHVRAFVRQFLVLHARRVVAALTQRHHARLAMGIAAPVETEVLAVLEHYQQSLATRAMTLRRFLLLFAGGGLLIAALVIPMLLPASGADVVLGDAARAVVAEQSPAKLYDAALEDPTATVVAFVVASTLTLGLLAIPLASFGYKRSLLGAPGDATSVRRNVRVTGGIYHQEASLQRAAGAERPLREVPFDLACLALALSLLFPLWLMLGVLAQDRLPARIGGLYAGALVPWLALGLCVVWAPWHAVRVYDLWLHRNAAVTVAERMRARLRRRAPALLVEVPADVVVPEPGGRSRRVVAAMIDGYLVVIIAYVVTLGGQAAFGYDDSAAGLIVIAMFPVGGALYGLPFHAQTPGKRLMGLRVAWIGGRMHGVLVRESVKWLVYGLLGVFTMGLPLIIGMIRARDRRLLHDRLAGTAVVAAPVAEARPSTLVRTS